MPIIMAVNPRKRKKKTRRTKAAIAKGTQPMAKKRKKAVKRRTYRRNPSRARRAIRRGARAAGSYGKSLVLGVNMSQALRSTIPLLLGALACKFTAKKFTDGGAEGDNWTWKNYAFGVLGTLVAAFATQALFKAKQGTATKVMEGGLLLVAYKIFTNEIAAKNDTLSEWFSGDESLPEMDGYYAGYGEELSPEDFTPGDIWQGDDTDYVMGEDGYWRPLDESHRAVGALGAFVEPATPGMGALGAYVETATPGMGGEDDFNYQW